LQSRTFLHVDDLIDGFFRVMKRRCSGDVFNIGGENAISIRELFNLLGRLAHYGQSPIFKSHFIDDHKRRMPDTAKIRSLGWRPRISLEAGLQRSYLERTSGPRNGTIVIPARRGPETAQAQPISLSA
jgi:nucleoside-diphosphate-sugar epimerase